MNSFRKELEMFKRGHLEAQAQKIKELHENCILLQQDNDRLRDQNKKLELEITELQSMRELKRSY